tara:strand:+ start:152 stop:394 length:243 start_codon:yes stop_codon:yes gene_type:complete
MIVKNIVTNPKYRYNNVAFSTPMNKAMLLTYSALSKLINPNIEPTTRNNLAKILEKGLKRPYTNKSTNIVKNRYFTIIII